MNRSLLAIALALATASAGCIIDRGPLVPVDADRPGDDAFVADQDADVDAPEEPIDAWRILEDDAALDAALEPDAWVDPIDAWAQPDTGPDAPRCTPRCEDASTLIACSGDVESSETCKLGCGGTPAHCFEVNPSNVATSLFDEASSELSITGNTTIDTGRDREGFPMGLVLTQSDGSPVAVLLHTTVTISATLTVVGQRPLILIARDGITITGAIDVSAMGATPGPRGLAGGTGAGGSASGPGAGSGGSHSGSYADGGGGGGGLCGTGGTGGTGSGARGGRGGGMTDVVADPQALRGGGGGGAGNGDYVGAGGAGGGALQISTRGTLTVTGRILARGSAGQAGGTGGGNDGSGGGGGAGGWVLLEGSAVNVSGGIDAMGGAGGGGGRGGGGGSAGGGATGSNGGNGGDNDRAFDAGNGGGGGGGAGCVIVRSFEPPMLVNVAPSDALGLHRLPLLLE